MDLITLTSPHATATISRYGGQVISYTPNGQPDVLWQTFPHFLQQAMAKGKPLRGGIPICWPWFRNHPTLPQAPSHGLARTAMWQIHDHQPQRLILQYATDGTHPAFPYQAQASLNVTLTNTLHITLTTTNLGDQPFQVTQALHTYVRVSDITHTDIFGLEQSPALFITPNQSIPASGHPLRLHGFHEHLYQNVPATLHLAYPSGPFLTLHHTGTTEAVVWNPGAERARSLDIPPGTEQQFLCLEAAHINTAPTLQSGESITLAVTLAPAA